MNKDYRGIRVLLIEGRARQIMPFMKSLYDLGCHITTYNTSKLDIGYTSKYPHEKLLSFFDESDPVKSFESIRDELKKKKYDVVIPLIDFPATILSQNKKELSQYAYIAVCDWDFFQNASDKLKTMKICMENDIPCPKTYIVDDNFDNLTDYIFEYPVVVKPRTGYAAAGFKIINNKALLIDTVKTTVSKYGPVLIQEYIPQTDVQYQCELYADRNGDIKSAVVLSKMRWYPINGGSSTFNTTVDRPDIIESCSKMLKLMKWKGYADVDLIQDPRDNTAKILELNPRATGGVKICFAAGVNFAEQILQDYLNKPVTEYKSYKKAIKLRNIHTDILWFLKSKDRFKTNPSWFDFKGNIDQILSWDDPLPFITYSFQGLKRLIMRN